MYTYTYQAGYLPHCYCQVRHRPLLVTELIEGQVLTHISDCHVLVIQVLLLVMVTDDITQVPQDTQYI